MNKQRKVLITITYNEMGIIIDTKAEEVAQSDLQPTCNQLATDAISRRAAIDAIVKWAESHHENPDGDDCIMIILDVPPAQPDITDEQAIGHLQASGWMQSHDKQMYEMGLKERLADDSDSYDALLPSAQPETAKRIVGKSRDGMTLWYQCDMCNEPVDAQDNFCSGCGRGLTDG